MRTRSRARLAARDHDEQTIGVHSSVIFLNDLVSFLQLYLCKMSQTTRAWEGLGGPLDVDKPNLEGIDPTLDACCRREVRGQTSDATDVCMFFLYRTIFVSRCVLVFQEESIRHGNAIKRTLQRHDVVAEKERRRRQLVQTPAFTGCRCCYDPNSDGSGEYRALIELRQRKK